VIITKATLEELYRRYNRRRYVHPDPLEFLYRYPDLLDREIAALIAASLAYGRVTQILRSVASVLDRMGQSPRDLLMKSTERRLQAVFSGFKHRFTTDDELVSMMMGMKRVITGYGSLNECFLAGLNLKDETVLPALAGFVSRLGCKAQYLLPSPEAGSACKRLNLFLRWMVRKDAVDPGGWQGVPRSKLIVPVDTHMAKIGQALALTTKKSANLHMALEITNSFRRFAPNDPVKYDFALTRFGIRDDMSIDELLDRKNN